MPLMEEPVPHPTTRRQSQPFDQRKQSIQSQHSVYARAALMSHAEQVLLDGHKNAQTDARRESAPTSNPTSDPSSNGSTTTTIGRPHASTASGHEGHLHQPDLKPPPYANGGHAAHRLSKDGVGDALSDTPLPSGHNSPRIGAMKSGSGVSTPRVRPTTLDIPGLTKSRVSPDGRIAQRDLGSKLVIVMVGLPARGKSYITKKMARYLNWLQHDTRIFNVGERRRVAAGGGGHRLESVALQGRPKDSVDRQSITTGAPTGVISQKEKLDPPQLAAQILINGEAANIDSPPPLSLPGAAHEWDSKSSDQHGPSDSQLEQLDAKFTELNKASAPEELPETEAMDQSASFFDPNNKKAAMIREQVALESLDELLDWIMAGGSVGILDATNSTLERRKLIMRHLRERAGNELNVLFVESLCQDENLLESNMRLKLSGPDYKDKDPIAALEDFKKRVEIYQRAYVPLGEYEEKNNMPYVQMIDVGRKVISHQIHGFLSAQAVYYLLNFNLAPRQIWITRHGESMDNVAGKIGGDSDLSPNGRRYAAAMANFLVYERKAWEVRQRDKAANTHFPPHPGDHTPPNPHYNTDDGEAPEKNFCVWTSMLKRSIQCAEYFNEEDFDIKQMRMLDELNAGIMEGMTYEEIRTKYANEFNLRRGDKMQYRYPGPGGEGYLDVINRLRPVIVELERMTDHCLLITHRSVARVLLAYFLGLRRDEVAELDCPLGMLYMLEPKPYGVEFKAYRYNPQTNWFDYLPDFKLRRAEQHVYE